VGKRQRNNSNGRPVLAGLIDAVVVVATSPLLLLLLLLLLNIYYFKQLTVAAGSVHARTHTRTHTLVAVVVDGW